MSKVVQWKRGNTAAVSAYTGLDGEIVVNTDNYTLAVHNGVNAGGITIGAVASNIGNLYVIDRTIYSSNVANTRITAWAGNSSFHVDGNYIVVGQNEDVLIGKIPNSNIALITTANRGDRNSSIYIRANASVGLSISPNNNIGIRTTFDDTADISYNGNLIPSFSTYNIGEPGRTVQDIYIGNTAFINNSAVTTQGNTLIVNGNPIYPANLNIQRFSANNTTTISTLANSNLQITASDGVHSSTVKMWAGSGKMSFNTESDAFDYNFNGYINGIGYVASANDPTGYSFYDPLQGYSGFRHVTNDPEYPDLTYISITHSNADVVKFISNLTTEMYGNLVVTTVGDAHGGFPTAPIQFYDNVASYSQLVHQNLSSHPEASTDVVLTADNGTDTEFYLDLGIASSQYAYPGDDAILPNDGYLIVNSGNLLLSASTIGKNVKVLVDGLEPQHIVAEFGNTVMTVNNVQTANVTATGYIKTVVDTVGNLLPATEVGIGARAFVTDANTITFASEVSGGGSNAVPVFSNGTVWCVG